MKKRRVSSTDNVPNKKAKIEETSSAEILIKGFCTPVGVVYGDLASHQKTNIGAFLDIFLEKTKTTISSQDVEPALREFRVQSIVDKQVRILHFLKISFHF